MPVSLTIVCNLERLAALDSLDSATNTIRLGFGLNLAPAAEGADTLAVLKPFLMPWGWNIAGVQIQYASNPPVAGDIVDQSPPPLPALSTRLESDLDKYATRLNQLARPVRTTTASSPGLPAADGTAPSNPNGQAYWSPRLLHLATYPFPLPQSLKLSHIFRVDIAQLNPGIKAEDYFKIPAANVAARRQWISDNLPGAKVLAAAPVLGAAGPFAVSRAPSNSGSQNQSWSYPTGDAAAPYITALVDPIPVAPPRDKFVDMATQWIAHPAGAAVDFAENWQAHLEVRFAEALRLPEFFVAYLRSHADKADATLNVSGLAAQVADIGLALIADCAGFGLVGATVAKGNSFAERLLATVNNISALDGFTLKAAQWAELEKASLSFHSLDQWKLVLKEAIPSLSDCGLLKSPPPAMTVAEIAVQFQRVLDQVFGTQHDEGKNDQVNLWSLFQKQWSKLLDKSALTPAEKNKIQQAVAAHASPPARTLPPGPPPPRLFDLRARLAQDNIDRLWTDFTGSNTSGDADGLNLIDICFPAYLNYYAFLRFGLPAQPVAGCAFPGAPRQAVLRDSYTLPCPQAPAALPADFAIQLAQRAATFKTILRPSVGSVAIDERVPQGITFSLGGVATDPALATQTASEDILEKISGSVVLMREVGTAAALPWQCLNYSETWLDDKVLRVDPAVVPYKVHYRGNLKQALVTYNNHAITTDSPLSEKKLIGGYVKNDDLKYDDAFLRFRYCGADAYASGGSLPPAFTVTPALKFGKAYQFAAFALTNTGVPPREVADTSPWLVRTNLPANLAVPPEAIIGKAAGLKYLRAVKVGALRIRPLVKNDENDPRVIPPNVSPRAREYEFFDDGSGAPPLSSQVPLVLLAPASFRFGQAGTRFAFDVRPPATGWECWDRWLAFDPTTADRRASAIAEIYRLTQLNQGKPDPEDISLDDPAVHTQFRMELHGVQPNGKLTTVPISARWVDFGGAQAGSPLKPFQRSGQRVTCKIAGTEEIVPADGGFEVRVKNGGLYRLALYPAVPKTNLDRFVQGSTADDPDLVLRAPTFFAIEVAKELVANKAEADDLRDKLWNACACVYHIEPAAANGPRGKEVIRVDLNPFRTASSDDFRYFHRAIVTHQAWRWTGRPVAQHPALAESPGADDLARWEAREFGDRLPIESIPHPMPVLPRRPNPVDTTDIRSFRYEQTPRDSKGRYDQRGQHHRFRIEAWSRYEGLLRSTQTASLVARPKLPAGAPDNLSNEWLSLFVPSRYQDPLPAPKVKLILPLTQSEPEDTLLPAGKDSVANSIGQLQQLEKQHRTAGLLVVLNEPWYERAGLGEEIEASVDLAPSPKNKLEETKLEDRRYYRQAGPDATVNVDQFRKADRLLKDDVADGDMTVSFAPGAIVGPVGHYFDADNTTALFVATSFILPPPKLPIDDMSTPWYMSRVKFRRKLTTLAPPPAAANASPPDYPDPAWKSAASYSPFTEPL